MLILLAVSSRSVTNRIWKTCHAKWKVNSFRQIITNFLSLGHPIVDLNHKLTKSAHQKMSQSIDIFPQRQHKKKKKIHQILLCGWHKLWGAKCLAHCKNVNIRWSLASGDLPTMCTVIPENRSHPVLTTNSNAICLKSTTGRILNVRNVLNQFEFVAMNRTKM